ncbi:hypothetical protein BT96DRAFT_1000706 [Gymnopus androsaceus JB14]|uniref:Uncharacterized protein n=1 Tax=Gymnopus androsaceus JB14 TaxID=1447944 RepID=A0A6A4H2Y8_9AGAR|nr:hypothetical protein BT96DRAFT_1000706 [Gymnopus androsaceus JB14]
MSPLPASVLINFHDTETPRMYIFPPRLKRIIRSSPSLVFDADRYQAFLAHTQPLLGCSSSEGFRAAVEPEWSALWNWLRAGLKVLHVYEIDQGDHLPVALRNTIISFVVPILLMLSEIVAGFHSDHATTILESYELKKLLALCVVVAFIEPDNLTTDDNNYQHCVLFIVRRIIRTNERSLGGFVKALEVASRSVIGTSLTDTWKNCLELQLIHPTYTSIQGHRLYLFLLVITLPGNKIHLRLNVARSAWPYVYRVWRILTSSKVSILGSATYSSSLLRLDCIARILQCHSMWMSGGPLWTATALDHRCLPMVYRTCHFLHDWSNTYPDLSLNYTNVIDLLQNLVWRVLRFWIFHEVSHRAQHSLSKTPSRRLSLGNTPTEVSLQAAWGQAIDTFCTPAMISFRKSMWSLTCANACEQPAAVLAAKLLPIVPGRAKLPIIEKVIGQNVKNLRGNEMVEHPIHSGRNLRCSDIPSLEKYYVYSVVVSRLQQLSSRICALIDGHTETRAVVVDFSNDTMALQPKHEVLEQLCPEHQGFVERNNGLNLGCRRILLNLETFVLIPYTCNSTL